MRGDTGFIHEKTIGEKSVAQFKGEGHTLYVIRENETLEIWFEDFCILGSGPTVLEALKNADEFTDCLSALLRKSIEQEEKRVG